MPCEHPDQLRVLVVEDCERRHNVGEQWDHGARPEGHPADHVEEGHAKDGPDHPGRRVRRGHCEPGPAGVFFFGGINFVLNLSNICIIPNNNKNNEYTIYLILFIYKK